MKINVLRKGDSVLSVSNDFVAVRRKNGEVDIIPIFVEGSGIRLDLDNIVTIGFGANTVEYEVDGITTIKF